MKKPPTCPLRKPCEECGKLYGRKLVKNNHYAGPQLQSEAVWRASACCSNSCGQKLRAKRMRAKKESIERSDSTRSVAIDQFLFGGRA